MDAVIYGGILSVDLQLDREHSTFWVVVFDPDSSTVAVDECLDEMKANPGPLTLKSLIPATKNILFMRIRDARSVVCDFDNCLVVIDGRTDSYFGDVFVVVLDGIFQQISEDGFKQFVSNYLDGRQCATVCDDR